MTDLQRAVHDTFFSLVEAGCVVATMDTTGSAVTRDLYALSLSAATRNRVHPVRVLTAVDDLCRGLRDYIRGPIGGVWFGRCYVDPLVKGPWNVD